MSLELFKSLLFKSSRIQRDIDREQRRRFPDWFRLLRLKKMRLAIKDHMARLVRKGLKKTYRSRRLSDRPNAPTTTITV